MFFKLPFAVSFSDLYIYIPYDHNQPNIKPTMQDPFLQIQTEHLKWTPNPGQCKMLDKIIEQTHRELEPYFVLKPLKFSNISKEEHMAILSL